jgi:hypothetical protein
MAASQSHARLSYRFYNRNREFQSLWLGTILFRVIWKPHYCVLISDALLIDLKFELFHFRKGMSWSGLRVKFGLTLTLPNHNRERSNRRKKSLHFFNAPLSLSLDLSLPHFVFADTNDASDVCSSHSMEFPYHTDIEALLPRKSH